jgi:hypothetical protein
VAASTASLAYAWILEIRTTDPKGRKSQNYKNHPRNPALSLANAQVAQVDSRGFEIDAGLTFGYEGLVWGISPIFLEYPPSSHFRQCANPESRMPPWQNSVVIPLGSTSASLTPDPIIRKPNASIDQ